MLGLKLNHVSKRGHRWPWALMCHNCSKKCDIPKLQHSFHCNHWTSWKFHIILPTDVFAPNLYNDQLHVLENLFHLDVHNTLDTICTPFCQYLFEWYRLQLYIYITFAHTKDTWITHKHFGAQESFLCGSYITVVPPGQQGIMSQLIQWSYIVLYLLFPCNVYTITCVM